MRVLAIDPGPTQSAWVLLQSDGFVRDFGITDNRDVRAMLRMRSYSPSVVVLEMIASYGMPVGREVFDTCVWIGRFIESAMVPHILMFRREVKLHLCNSARAKDANVRQALLDRYGPGRQKAMGTKAKPGPLYGVRKDVWAALGVAVTFMDRQQANAETRVEAIV